MVDAGLITVVVEVVVSVLGGATSVVVIEVVDSVLGEKTSGVLVEIGVLTGSTEVVVTDDCTAGLDRGLLVFTFVSCHEGAVLTVLAGVDIVGVWLGVEVTVEVEVLEVSIGAVVTVGVETGAIAVGATATGAAAIGISKVGAPSNFSI